MDNINFINYVKKNDDPAGDSLTPSRYLPNDYEVWGARFIAPLKGLLSTEERDVPKLEKYEHLQGFVRTSLKIMQYIMLPLAMLGTVMKHKGEDLNPGYSLREEIAAKRNKIRRIENYLGLVGLGLVNDGIMHTQLIRHIQKIEKKTGNTTGEAWIANQLASSQTDSEEVKRILLQNKDVPVVKYWFQPMEQIRQNLQQASNRTELDISRETEVILEYAQKLAPMDSEWHQDIREYFASALKMAPMQDKITELNALSSEIQALFQKLENQYK